MSIAADETQRNADAAATQTAAATELLCSLFTDATVEEDKADFTFVSSEPVEHSETSEAEAEQTFSLPPLDFHFDDSADEDEIPLAQLQQQLRQKDDFFTSFTPTLTLDNRCDPAFNACLGNQISDGGESERPNDSAVAAPQQTSTPTSTPPPLSDYEDDDGNDFPSIYPDLLEVSDIDLIPRGQIYERNAKFRRSVEKAEKALRNAEFDSLDLNATTLTLSVPELTEDQLKHFPYLQAFTVIVGHLLRLHGAAHDILPIAYEFVLKNLDYLPLREFAAPEHLTLDATKFLWETLRNKSQHLPDLIAKFNWTKFRFENAQASLSWSEQFTSTEEGSSTSPTSSFELPSLGSSPSQSEGTPDDSDSESSESTEQNYWLRVRQPPDTENWILQDPEAHNAFRRLFSERNSKPDSDFLSTKSNDWQTLFCWEKHCQSLKEEKEDAEMAAAMANNVQQAVQAMVQQNQILVNALAGGAAGPGGAAGAAGGGGGPNAPGRRDPKSLSQLMPNTLFSGLEPALSKDHMDKFLKWVSWQDMNRNLNSAVGNDWTYALGVFELFLKSPAKEWFQAMRRTNPGQVASPQLLSRAFMRKYNQWGQTEEEWEDSWMSLKYDYRTHEFSEFRRDLDLLGNMLGKDDAGKLMKCKRAMPYDIKTQVLDCNTVDEIEAKVALLKPMLAERDRTTMPAINKQSLADVLMHTAARQIEQGPAAFEAPALPTFNAHAALALPGVVPAAQAAPDPGNIPYVPIQNPDGTIRLVEKHNVPTEDIFIQDPDTMMYYKANVPKSAPYLTPGGHSMGTMNSERFHKGPTESRGEQLYRETQSRQNQNATQDSSSGRGNPRGTKEGNGNKDFRRGKDWMEHICRKCLAGEPGHDPTLCPRTQKHRRAMAEIAESEKRAAQGK
jgi:hypothetical protein